MAVNGLMSLQFVPVILGAGRQSAYIAQHLFWQHGLVSHMVAPRISLFRRLTPWLICHSLAAPTTELMLLALLDLAADIEKNDRTPLLYLCDDTPPLPDSAISTLETAFILYHQETPLPCTKGEHTS